jgi:nitrite reductase/ring-hydroxylating ferredoxin subunit
MPQDRLEVCDVEQLPPGERLLVEVDDKAVCVLNVEGELFALGARCAHRGGPICKGELGADRRTDGDELTVTCPWHGWTYDVATGRRIGPTDHSLGTYSVLVENETVYLVVDSGP